jgi:transaldolase
MNADIEVNRMKIFLDTANIDQIRKAAGWGVIDGVTTNPTLAAKENREFRGLVDEICKIVDGPISAEVISSLADGMVTEAQELAKIHKNIVVKIPVTPEGLKAVKILRGMGIRSNVTLAFSANQALLAAKAGAAFVSPFIGRLDDAGLDGMAVVRDIMQIYKNYGFTTEVIVASIRHPIHVHQAALAGAHIATVPFSVLELLFKHPFTDVGIERFLRDWEKVPKKQ